MEGHICGSLRTQEQTRHMEEWEGGLYEGRSLHSGLLKFNPITLPKKLVMFCCPVSVPWNDQQQKCSTWCTKYMPGTCTSHFSHQLHKLPGHSLFGKYMYLTLYICYWFFGHSYCMQYFRAPLVRHLNVLHALTMKHFTKIPHKRQNPWWEGWGNHHSHTRCSVKIS